MDQLPIIDFNSVEDYKYQASFVFTTPSQSVFKDDIDTPPRVIDKSLSYMPWGADDQMPYDVLRLVEDDETLATCQQFNAEVCYGSGLEYVPSETTPQDVLDEMEEFALDNDLASYFLGVCNDFKHFGFCVSVIILNNEDNPKVVRLLRKEACYCRFTPADAMGRIPKVLYANWRKSVCSRKEIEVIDLLDTNAPWADLKHRLEQKTKTRKFAVVSRIPTPDHCYYPIPYYAALFKGNWYNIKQLIGLAKEAKLKNAAPIKYHIEISAKYWTNMFHARGITDKEEMKQLVKDEKQKIINFITGTENAGKVLFSTYYVNPDGQEQHDVVINTVDGSVKEGGDWSTDIIEAVNMVCFTMRVHSNLVGSVPGKSQTNNSGSDKRELYTIAQALQKPYHDILFAVHRIIIRQNGWKGVKPDCPFIQLTTLDENRDAKPVTTSQEE